MSNLIRNEKKKKKKKNWKTWDRNIEIVLKEIQAAFNLHGIGSSGKLLRIQYWTIRLHKYQGMSVPHITIPSIVMLFLEFVVVFDIQLNNIAYI